MTDASSITPASDPAQPETIAASIPNAPDAQEAPVAFTPENWKEMLPADTREWSAVKEAATPKDLMDKFGYLQTRAGRSINIPNKDSSPEDRQEFLTKLRDHVPELTNVPLPDDNEGLQSIFSKLGRPEEVNGYNTPEFDLVEGVTVSDQQLDFAKTLAHKHNLTNKQYEGFVGDFLKASLQESNAQQTDFNTKNAQLREEWGDAYEQKSQKAASVAQVFFPNSGIAEMIAQGTVGAGALRDLEALSGRLGTEGQQLVGHQGGTGVNTPQELRDEANQLLRRSLDAPPGAERDNINAKRIKLLQAANR